MSDPSNSLMQSLGRLRRDQHGGAMVEFAVSTLVFVPLVLYGIWFADAMHFAVIAEEAAIEPAFDATAHLTHDYNGNNTSPDGLVSPVALSAGQQVQTELGTSYDSYNTTGSSISSSVLVHPQSLTIDCTKMNNSGSGPLSAGQTISNVVSSTVSLLPMNTWIACTSKLAIDPATLMPHQFAQNFADTALYAGPSTITLCGIGQGPSGCGVSGGPPPLGFPIFLDDWGLENGAANPLSIGSSGGNAGYFNVGNQFFVNAGDFGIIAAMGAVTTLPIDLGATGNFRLTYKVAGDGSYSDTESTHGQGGPLGGPSGPHTGGPWHEEHSAHSDLAQNTFSSRTNSHYLARSDWPND